MVDLWHQVGVLPRLIRTSLENYPSLLVEAEHMCLGANLSNAAKVFLEHHSQKLLRIRTFRARTRIQLIWMTYTYLRNGRASKWVSTDLQKKQTDTLQDEMEALRLSHNCNGNNNNRNNDRGNGGGNGGGTRAGNGGGNGGNGGSGQ